VSGDSRVRSPGGDRATATAAISEVSTVPPPRHRGDVHVEVSGDIDILTAPELSRRLHDHLDALPVGGSLRVDLARDRGVALHLGPLSRHVQRLLDLCDIGISTTAV
jgi:hypothetical protein